MTAAAVPPEPSAAAGPPQRPLPQRPLRAALFVALGLFLAALAAWEWRARGQGLVAGDLGDSPAAWAEQRRRVTDDPHQVLVIGDSRILLGTDLGRHAELTGARPLQLALVGASGLPVLEDLARHRAFRGLVIVGVSELHYFGAPEDGAQAALSGADVAAQPRGCRCRWPTQRCSPTAANGAAIQASTEAPRPSRRPGSARFRMWARRWRRRIAGNRLPWAARKGWAPAR